MADGFIPPHGGYGRLFSYRKAGIIYDATYEAFRKGIEHADPEISANVIIGLIKVDNYLLDQQIRRLEKDFLKNGGLRERMTLARLRERDKQRRRPEGYWDSIAAAFRLCGRWRSRRAGLVGTDCTGAHREEGHHGSRP